MNQVDTYKADSLGTTIMACLYDGGVLLGGDTRVTQGAYIPNRGADKVEYVCKKIYCLKCGSAADSQIIIKYLKYDLENHAIELNEDPQLKTAAKILSQILFQYKNSLQSSFILGGYDKTEGFSLFQITKGGSCFKRDYAISGSGGTYITAHVDKNYRTGMSYQECRKFMIDSMSLAMARDGSSGGCIRLVNVTKDKEEREFIEYNKLPNKM